MPVHAAVLTLDPSAAPTTLQKLGCMEWLTLGEPQGFRLPVVADPPDRDADRVVWRAIEHLAGITHIELVFSEFSDLTQPEVST
ncbi:MAG: hypothetical protein ACI9MC_003639 [Kiritimatiellia bacterium]|jgi:hypothetical protein